MVRMTDTIEKAGCATCGKPTGDAADFRDELSMREYTVSRMCQVCQDRLPWVLAVAEVELDRLTKCSD